MDMDIEDETIQMESFKMATNTQPYNCQEKSQANSKIESAISGTDIEIIGTTISTSVDVELISNGSKSPTFSASNVLEDATSEDRQKTDQLKRCLGENAVPIVECAVPMKRNTSTSRSLQEQSTDRELDTGKRLVTSPSRVPLSREGEVTEASECQVTEASEGQVTEASEGQVTEASEGQVTEASEGQVTEAREGMVERPRWSHRSFHTSSSETFKSQPTFESQLKVLSTPAVERPSISASKPPTANELFTIYLRTVKESAVDKQLEQKRKGLAEGVRTALHETQPGITEVRSKASRHYERLESIRSDFRPWFILTVSLIQLSIVAWECGSGGLDTISVWPHTRNYNVTESLGGSSNMKYTEIPNMWIGPSTQRLISMGAFFPACIRGEHRVRIYNAKQGITGDVATKLGCCEVESVNAAGTTTKEHCLHLSHGVGKWRETRCSERTNRQGQVAHVLRPCCYGLAGKCKLTNGEHCHVIQGQFHLHAERCAEVNCLEALCGNADLQPTADLSHHSKRHKDPQQWWRVVLGLIHHHGLIDCGTLITLQMIVGVRLESRLGWLYMGITYLLTGLTGQMIGSLSVCTHWPQAGGFPALSGLLAVALVEQVELWKALGSPMMGTLRYIFVMVLVIALGSFPRVNNFSNLAGFLQGIILAPMFLNFCMTKGRKRLERRIMIFKLCCFLIVLLSLVISIAFFYEVQKLDICPACCYIDCVPYVTGLCDTGVTTA